MALVTWTGGTHRISDPGVWLPNPPAPGDTGLVLTGHVVSINQTAGPYAIALDGNDDASGLDAVGSTLTGSIGGFFFGDTDPLPNQSPAATIGLLGSNTNTGQIVADSFYIANSFPSITIRLADVTSPTAVIQQAILVNDGMISSGEGVPISVFGPADAILVNNGVFDVIGGEIDAAITGTGVIYVYATPRDQTPVDLRGPVSAGQSLIVYGPANIDDPRDFRATIKTMLPDAPLSSLTIKSAVTSGSFIDHTLTLMNESTFVTQFKFANDITLADLAIDSGGPTTTVRTFDQYGQPGNLVLSSTGPVPVPPPVILPAAVPLLPGSGPDITDTTQALAASIKILDGYMVRLESPVASTLASLSVSSVTFGTHFALQVDALASGQSHGALYAIGYNQNNGSISASGTGSALSFGIGDDTSPTGVTVLAGTFNNTGTISATHGATIDITGSAASKLINSGTLLTDGMMFVGTTVTGAGTVTVGDHNGQTGSLAFGGYVATGQMVNLQAGTLTIDDTQHFFATVYDFDARDTIVLKGLNVSSVKYDNGRLLLDNGADGTLHFHRPNGVSFDTGSFNLSHSGTDTIITTPVKT